MNPAEVEPTILIQLVLGSFKRQPGDLQVPRENEFTDHTYNKNSLLHKPPPTNLHPQPQIYKQLAPSGPQHQAPHHGRPGLLPSSVPLVEQSP
ncbi:hypothetical protein EYF80_014823 [Liparis tanakae]|uniref:Uncharacterized protein n=1 Tax=Liparis tanakae TaxID=230148 RepID=A0A4Z2IBS9_9TELE|nr:hypothetical protein EYF80_014823 [Liparis tanakae]